MEIFSSFSILKILSVLAMVLAFIVGISIVVRYAGRFMASSHGRRGLNRPPARLVESLQLDPKRRVVVLEWAGEEHMILLGQHDETLIRTMPLIRVSQHQPVSGNVPASQQRAFNPARQSAVPGESPEKVATR